MQDHHLQLPWEQPDWLQQATEWIHAQLPERRMQITGPVELMHQRPWSAFARVSTANGTAYFKAPAPAYKYEVALTQALARWRPDCTVRLLGVDLDRGWLLSADAGVTLRRADGSLAQIDQTHGEVHDANVLVSGDGYTFTDWSDSSVAHPFFTVLVTIRAAAYRLELAEFGPEMMRLRDAYLEPWTTFATRRELLTAFDLAHRLGMANRALSWHYDMRFLAERHKEPYADAVPGWLQDFLNANTPEWDKD